MYNFKLKINVFFLNISLCLYFIPDNKFIYFIVIHPNGILRNLQNKTNFVRCVLLEITLKNIVFRLQILLHEAQKLLLQSLIEENSYVETMAVKVQVKKIFFTIIRRQIVQYDNCCLAVYNFFHVFPISGFLFHNFYFFSFIIQLHYLIISKFTFLQQIELLYRGGVAKRLQLHRYESYCCTV